MKKIQRESGQALLEFALIFPLIFLIIILFIELGRIEYYYSALTNAVREGARYAIVTQFTSSTQRTQNVQNKVVQYSVALPINPADVTIYCDRDTTDLDNPCHEYVTVRAHMEIDPMVGFVSLVLGSGTTYNINAESTMQMTPYGRYVP